MNQIQQQEAAQAVASWIAEHHGDRIANDWLWSCTPYPCGLPSEEMLYEGLDLALGEVTMPELLQKVEAVMEREMAAYREQQEKK